MTLKLIFAGAALLALSACAHSPKSSGDTIPVRAANEPVLTVTTDSANGLFEVALFNPTGSDVCVADGDWPSAAYLGKEATPSGSLHRASDRVFAVVGNNRFPIEDENLGYCDDSVTDLQDGYACRTAVVPGQTLVATIPFARFPGLVQASVAGAPTLSYDPSLSSCGN